jgi:hypothetical protein
VGAQQVELGDDRVVGMAQRTASAPSWTVDVATIS